MDRTSASNYLLNAGLRQYQDVNQALNIQGTSLVAADRNAVQEELMAIEGRGGVVPNAASWSQVAQAIARVAAGNVTSITAAGSSALTPDNAGLLVVNAAAGNVVLDLPPVATPGATPVLPLQFRLVRTDSTANTVVLAANGTDGFVDGGWAPITAPALAQGEVLHLCGDGAAHWLVEGAAHGLQIFTSSGTFTAPVTGWYEVEGWGAGGGASGGTGGGGGGGEYRRGRFFLVAGQAVACTIGAGGAGASNAAQAGAGGSTSFGGLLIANGGGGANAGAGAGGSGGTGGVEAIAGGSGVDVDGVNFVTGVGGVSARGGAAGVVNSTASIAPPVQPGAGGSMAQNLGSGQSGAAGQLNVRW